MKEVCQLVSLLREHLGWNLARVTLVAQFVTALIKVRSVNLTRIAQGFSGSSQVDSNYKRLQRFFRGFDFSPDELTPLFIHLSGVKSPWIVCIDRTHWKLGRTEHNLLVLSVACEGVSIPLMIKHLDRSGMSNTVTHSRYGHKINVTRLFSLSINESMYLNKKRKMWGSEVYLACYRSEQDWIIIMSDQHDHRSLSDYIQRWKIETLFQSMKGRGFDLEATHLVDPYRVEKMIALVTLAFCWCYRVGSMEQWFWPIKRKKHGRLSQSIFRLGLDTIHHVLINLTDRGRDWINVLKPFIYLNRVVRQ